MNNEPCLLVGETGTGKTTAVQIVSYCMKIEKILECTEKNEQENVHSSPAHHHCYELAIVNCHQQTESSDFLGSQRPIRNKGDLEIRLNQVRSELGALVLSDQHSVTCSDQELVRKAKKMLKQKTSQNVEEDQKLKKQKLEDVSSGEDVTKLQSLLVEMLTLNKRLRAYFEWVDGPLVNGMRQGSWVLFDEISLAEDGVIERLNSVLEDPATSRSILLSEKPSQVVEMVHAAEGFRWALFNAEVLSLYFGSMPFTFYNRN